MVAFTHRAVDTAGILQLKAHFETNIDAIPVSIYSTWVNVSGSMHPPDETQEMTRGATELPGLIFSSQIATLMLVETEDLLPLIAPIVWPTFGAAMGLRYPTQPLRVAANTPTIFNTTLCKVGRISTRPHLPCSS